MTPVRRWSKTEGSPRVRLVYLVLLANGLPAFIILMLAPGRTEDLFVWTVEPPASARLLGAMYGNALLLVGIGLAQPTWPRLRITFVVIAFFSVAATLVTLFNLGPFLKHPWFHLAYWLSMYLVLFFAAPAVFVVEQRRTQREAVSTPLGPGARLMAALCAGGLGVAGLALFADPSRVSEAWPWTLTPLVGRLIAVWFTALALAYAWALWDADWLRARPIFIQGIPTAILLALVPLLHRSDLKAQPAAELAAYLTLAGLMALTAVVALATRRGARAGAAGA